MNAKKISLAGEVHISGGSVHTTVDALYALESIGIAYGLYSPAEGRRNYRVTLEGGDHPALVMQENISHHGTPLWETVKVVADDPKQIKRYMAFRSTVQMIQEMDFEQERDPTPGKSSPPKKKEAHGRER
ncbi:hypothetical protein [Oscillibacter sp.]|uniref:hypothetical protein n=1 Tax=Oscillibacter sp. TaxID=1945593 RepID=UPI002D80B0C5|nr:hypothetical protein [Oscillibacter sp.]